MLFLKLNTLNTYFYNKFSDSFKSSIFFYLHLQHQRLLLNLVDIRLLQNRFNFILVQLQNTARFDGRISSDETKILRGLKDMVSDLPNILGTISETADVSLDSNKSEDVQKLLDEMFQFILGHLMDIARSDDHVSEKESELLEMIAEQLEKYLENYIKTGIL